MDDISRELPPDSTGAAPVSERQKGPEELQRFELGHIGEDTGASPSFGDRVTGLGVNFLADRLLQVNNPADKMSGDEPSSEGESRDTSSRDSGSRDAGSHDVGSGAAEPVQSQGLDAGADNE